MRSTVKVALVIGSLLVSSSALAATPYPNLYTPVGTYGNKWRITRYYDTTSTQALIVSQELCFSNFAANGTGVSGTWKALTFSGWDGRYYQEGDQFRMTGDYGSNTGHDHMTCEFITGNLASCIWDEWNEDAGYGSHPIMWANATMERIGTCTMPLTAAAVAERITVSGGTAASPGQKGLESVKDYQLRTGN